MANAGNLRRLVVRGANRHAAPNFKPANEVNTDLKTPQVAMFPVTFARVVFRSDASREIS